MKPTRPVPPELRAQLVRQLARLLEADWRRRHAADREPAIAPIDPAPRALLKRRKR